MIHSRLFFHFLSFSRLLLNLEWIWDVLSWSLLENLDSILIMRWEWEVIFSVESIAFMICLMSIFILIPLCFPLEIWHPIQVDQGNYPDKEVLLFHKKVRQVAIVLQCRISQLLMGITHDWQTCNYSTQRSRNGETPSEPMTILMDSLQRRDALEYWLVTQ